MADKILHGAIALIKSGGRIIGKMKSVRLQESYQRMEVVGIGTIFASEAPVIKFSGTLTCSAMAISFKKGIIPGAIKRDYANILSQVATGGSSLEDALVLDDRGIDVELYQKTTDVFDAVTGELKPKLIPFAIARQCLIESASLDVSEGGVSGIDQSFKYLQAAS